MLLLVETLCVDFVTFVGVSLESILADVTTEIVTS